MKLALFPVLSLVITAFTWRTPLIAAAPSAGVMMAQQKWEGLPVAQPAEIGLSAAALHRIAPAMQSYIDSGKVAGMVMMIARHGKIGYTHTLGYSDVEKQIPIRPDAIFRLASIRKPLLAAATMVLVDSGKIDLDDAVSKYIPSFARVQLYTGGSADAPALGAPARPITIRHLLTHTAGLAGGYGDHPVDAIYKRVNLQRTMLTLAEFADGLAAMPLEFSPGDQWRYSRSFEVIGRVIEVASGMPLDKFLHEQFLSRLGTQATFLTVSPAIEHVFQSCMRSIPRGSFGPPRAQDEPLPRQISPLISKEANFDRALT